MPTVTNPTAEALRVRVHEAIDVFQRMGRDEELADALTQAVAITVRALRSGGKILLCGNGGSSADAQHFAAELVGKFMLDREPWAAIALSDNVAAVTAIANDYAYEDVFARGVRAHGRTGDVLIGLSTSGKSRNVVAAFEAARALGVLTVAFVGPGGSPLADVADIVLHVDGAGTARIQEGHKLLGHTLFELVESELVRVS